MSGFRACLQAVSALARDADVDREGALLGCEDCREKVCEGGIRVRCDRLPEEREPTAGMHFSLLHRAYICCLLGVYWLGLRFPVDR